MKDSLLLMQIYRTFLENTGDLIEILENHLQKSTRKNISQELKDKYSQFRKHTNALISILHNDIHNLLRIDNELKELEDTEEREDVSDGKDEKTDKN